MHELGVLCEIVRTVERVMGQNGIRRVRYIALEVGTASGFVPEYLLKLFPVASDGCSVLHGAKLQITDVPGTGLVIKELGY